MMMMCHLPAPFFKSWMVGVRSSIILLGVKNNIVGVYPLIVEDQYNGLICSFYMSKIG